MTKPIYTWAKQKLGNDFKIIDCKTYDPYKDFRRDPTGIYMLIRPDFGLLKIEVAICNKEHEIIKVFRGAKCQDLYDGIFQYEKKNGLTWFKDKGHIAYLGKELKKAEFALVLGQNSYFQE
jgi:hypothetical protein